MMNRKGFNKIFHSVVAVFLLFGLSFSVAPKAYAQLATVSPDVTAQMTGERIVDKVKDSLKKALHTSLSAGMFNLLSAMANTFATNTAVWVASGGNAESPLYNVTPPADYFKHAGVKVLSDVFNEIVVDNLKGGLYEALNTYLPTDPDVLQAIRLGVQSLATNHKVDYEYLVVKSNWSSYLAVLGASGLDSEEKTMKILSMVGESFNSDVNELSSTAKVFFYAITESYSQAENERQQLLVNDGFLGITHYITGQLETPASLVRDELVEALSLQKRLPFDLGVSMMAGSDTLAAVGVNAGGIFVSTLFSELMVKFQNGLLEDIASDNFDPFSSDGIVEYSRDRIQAIFKSLTTFKPLEITDYSLLADMATCPSTVRGSSVGLYNCTLNSSFVSAVALSRAGSTLTLQDAIDEGYIDSGWPLIPSSDEARNQDTKCYTYGFCHSNIVKLRKARIISIGWELASESSSNSDTNPVTLQEVISGFYSCNSDGELDDEHPWCHLIDPNWVLKFPETQCRTLAYGQILTGAGTDQRSEECVDIQSCISEENDGNCDGGYGYCVREQNTWKFRGSECPEQYASCLSFEMEDDTAVDYLTNTIDYSDCSISNVGCLWYSTQKEKIEGVFEWPEINDVAVNDSEDDAYKNRLYLNDEVTSCSEEDAGCEHLYERESDTALNLISNSSFELDSNEDGIPDSWLIDELKLYDQDGDYNTTGDDAIWLTDSIDVERYGIVLNQTRYYALSLYAYSPSQDPANVSLEFYDEDGNALNISYQSINGSCDDDTCHTSCEVSSTSTNELEMSVETQDDYFVRFECIFTTPTLTDRSLDIFAKLSLSGEDTYIDDIMLEQDADTTMHSEGYSDTSLESVYIKVAPDYLGCTGSSSDDDGCANYAQMCSEQDAGCGEYTPVNGDPSVTAVVSTLDECPSACDGYDTYRQEASTYEPFGEFPIYFIPSTADTCSDDAVGCTEFTNLDTEVREYYTYLRTCITEDQAEINTNGDNQSIYYTWEGSDEEGYQLRTWRLLESDLDSSAYYGYSYNLSGEKDVRPGLAPCTNWSTNDDGISCNDDQETPALTFDTDNEFCDEHSDIWINPDCREFYDTSGGIHYREWDLTVTINNDCDSYRITDLVGDDVSEMEDVCDASNGYYDSGSAFCRFYGNSSESIECSESDNGCRAFTGGRSANSRLILDDLFEDGSIVNWDSDSASAVTLSNESVAVDGHSLKSESESVWSNIYDYGSECALEDGCPSSTGTLGGSCTVGYGDRYCGTFVNELFINKTYTLTFWAKGDVDLEVGFDLEVDDSNIVIDSLVNGLIPSAELTSEWTYYAIGPFDMNENDYPEFGNDTVLAFVPDGSGDFYIDNVVLREGEDELTLIKDSWTTPTSCDQTTEGATSPQYHLGCQEYTDQNEETWYLKSFRNLCDLDAVGCSSYYATEQSDSDYVAVYNATCYNIDSDSDGSADLVEERTGCYVYANLARTEFDETSPLLCNIADGENSCLFDFEDWFIPQADVSDVTNKPELYHLSYGPDTTFVKADTDVYLIYDEEIACSSSSIVGCTEFGEPTFSDDLTTVADWNSVYYVNDPDEYDEILCDSDGLFCESFESTSDGTWYFKTPLQASIGHTCEYKTDIRINDTSYTGWFRKDTSEFCYGTGSCSDDSSISCEKDSECAVLNAGECDITDGSYLIGGTESGMWRNGDDQYDGWVGECSAEYDMCSAFEDTLAVDDDEFYGFADGEMYYYIDNDRLTDSNLLSSQKCNGQVSQKEGCTLFYDNSESRVKYNASATYIVSAHADELLGESPFSLVEPIDCTSSNTSEITLSDGSIFDACASRCVYDNFELHTGITISATTGSRVLESIGYDIETFEDAVTIGSSCYNDSDCPTIDGDTGDKISGTCGTTATWYAVSGRSTTMSVTENIADVSRLENDSNRVISVNQDRVCAEWLSCSSSYSVWDQDLGRYRTICDGIDLCTEYSAEGHPSFCSEWDPSDPAIVLDMDRYVTRDVTWYGEEYSGYSVPNLIPLQHLDQVNIAPPVGYCDLSDTSLSSDDSEWSDYHGIGCEDETSDCGSGTCIVTSDKSYRLGLIAGSCSDEHSEDCAVGYCTDNNSACTTDNDCQSTGALCVPGICYAIGTDACNENSDCDTSAGEECLSGTCSTQGDYCDLDTLDCDTNETCFTSVSYKAGSCYGGSCFLAVNGEPFENEMYEGQVCRAYPEIDSPFGSNVVSEWNVVNNTSLDQTSDLDDALDNSDISAIVPRTFLPGFEEVETCAAGEDCVCSYTKVSSANTEDVFLGTSSSYLDEDFLGICSALSAVAGAICEKDDDCIIDDPRGSEADATCERVTDESTLYGLNGYCLERDTGLNIEGDQFTGACLTWFPVDHLAGSTDLYAKYTGAGYDGGETEYCAYIAPYADIEASQATKGSETAEWKKESGLIACAETVGTGDDFEKCVTNNDYFHCPPGFFAVMGGTYDEMKTSNDQSFANYCTAGVGGQDCPFICVPNSATKESESGDFELCRDIVENVNNSAYEIEEDSWGVSSYDGDVYFFPTNSVKFDELVMELQGNNCVAKGIEIDTDWGGVTTMIGQEDDYSSGRMATDGYSGYYQDAEVYIGCKRTVEVDDGEYINSAPYTDRLLNPNSGFDIDANSSNFKYNYETTSWPFGAAVSHSIIDGSSDATPSKIASCDDGSIYSAPEKIGFCGTGSTGRRLSFTDEENELSTPEARAFVDFEFEITESETNAGYKYFDWILTSIVDGTDLSEVEDSIDQVNFIESLFAVGLGVLEYADGLRDGDEYRSVNDVDYGSMDTYTSSETDGSYWEWDNSDTGTPPTIWAVDVNDCGGQYCTEGEADAITLNNQSTGDFESSEGFFRATLKFFGAAFKEQLPIRRVVVDWGDGEDLDPGVDDNFYKNHRGLQDGIDGDDSLTASKCDIEDPDWGMTGDSCDPNYFVYQYSYRCNISEMNIGCEYDSDNNLTNSPCTDDEKTCVYQPRVHIRDNWGWCTGTCGTDGCFDAYGDLSYSDPLSECNYERYPSISELAINPWVYYHGIIKVEE